MKLKMQYKPKRRGGRKDNITTFITACGRDNVTTTLTFDKSLQFGVNDDGNSFAYVGLTHFNKEPVIVKMMNALDNSSKNEVKIQELFIKTPHVNIVQGICNFECKNELVKFSKEFKTKLKICDMDKNDLIQIIIQEYIPKGSMKDNLEMLSSNPQKWKSILLQLTFASLELFEKHKFVYNDWHSGNILLDIPYVNETTRTYKALNNEWVVELEGLSPVLTDFSNSETIDYYQDFETKKDLKRLYFKAMINELVLVWEMMGGLVCPVQYKVLINEYATALKSLRFEKDLLNIVNKLFGFN